MIFAVGSKNPVKIRAVSNVVKKIWPKAKIVSVEVKSGVSNQPFGFTETIKGAINRAKESQKIAKADFGVGLEGAVSEIKPYGYFSTPFCAVVNSEGKIGVGIGGGMELPKFVVSELLKGKELGEVMDEKTGMSNSKQKMGAVGILTDGLLTRQKSYEQMFIFALTKFIKKDFYNK